MDSTRVVLLIVAALLLGCNRSANVEDQSPSASTTTATVQSGDSTAIPTVPNAEPASAQEAIQVMQERLQTSIVANDSREPAPADVESTIVFGKAQRQRFPNDDNLTQSVAAMMFQSIRFLQEQPDKLMERRLEVGKIARELIAKPDVANQSNSTLSFLLLEEAKGLVQSSQLDASWNSIVKARELGFDQSKLFFLDPAFEPIIQNEGYANDIQTWLHSEIDKEIAQQEAFPFEFSLRSLDAADTTVSLADFQDKELILLDFWGTWCGPCRAAVPHLVELQETFKEQLAIVGVSFEQPIGSVSFEDTKARVNEYRESQPINYTCVYADFDPRTVIPEFKGFPTMLLVDKRGRARLQLSGYHPLPLLETAIRRVLVAK